MALTDPAGATGPTDSRDPDDGVVSSPLRAFLSATDLDELLARRQQLGDATLDAADHGEVLTALLEWTDLQAVSNLLMYPQVIPAAQRNAEVQRGLDDVENPYARLAAVVGIGELDLSRITDIERHRFVHTLLDLIANDGTVCAERASFSIVWLMRQPDTPDILETLNHPSPRVRHNVLQGLLELLGTPGLAALLELPGFVARETQQRALEAVDEAGIDLSVPADDQRRPLVLAFVPNYADFQPAD
jgi:hypothetical protein